MSSRVASWICTTVSFTHMVQDPLLAERRSLECQPPVPSPSTYQSRRTCVRTHDVPCMFFIMVIYRNKATRSSCGKAQLLYTSWKLLIREHRISMMYDPLTYFVSPFWMMRVDDERCEMRHHQNAQSNKS